MSKSNKQTGVKKDRRCRRGFASLSLERRRELSSKGGKRAHELGKGHVFTPEEAQAASRAAADRNAGPLPPLDQARIGRILGSDRGVGDPLAGRNLQ